jgi:hypothetical protein
VRLYLFILISFIVEREGVEVNVFFSPSFDMCQEEGKGVTFFHWLVSLLVVGKNSVHIICVPKFC